MKKSKTRKASPSGKMSLSGHLKELRNRIIVVLLVLLVGFCICLYFSPRLMTLLTDMGKDYDYVFVYIAPAETLLEQIEAYRAVQSGAKETLRAAADAGVAGNTRVPGNG